MFLNAGHSVFEKIDYEKNITCNISTRGPLRKSELQRSPQTCSKKVPPLVGCCIRSLLTSDSLVEKCIQELPHLAQQLLREAVTADNHVAIAICVSEWPYDTLVFKEACRNDDAFLTTNKHAMDIAIMMGLFRREKVDTVKCNTIDFRGVRLASDGKIEAKTLLSWLCIEEQDFAGYSHLFPEVLTSADFINEKLQFYETGYIYVPEGERLQLVIDNFDTAYSSALLQEFVFSELMKSCTQCDIIFNKLVVRPLYGPAGSGVDSGLAALLCAQRHLQYLLIEDCILRDSAVINMMVKDENMPFFSRIEGLQLISDINYDFTWRFPDLLRNCDVLKRLDLSLLSQQSPRIGDILECLQNNLEYFKIQDGPLLKPDKDAFLDMRFRHKVTNIREINWCGVSSIALDDDAIDDDVQDTIWAPDDLLDVLDVMTENVVVCIVQNNSLNHDNVDRICDWLMRCKCLNILDLVYNRFPEESLLRIVSAAALVPSMRCLVVNMLPELDATSEQRESLQVRMDTLLQRAGRTDVNVVLLAYGLTL